MNLTLKVLESPEYWSKHKLTVTVDGYTEDGVRIHLVDEFIPPQFLSGAVVMSDVEYFAGVDITKTIEKVINKGKQNEQTDKQDS